MTNLMEAFPDAKTLLALEPEELGGVLLELVRPTALRPPGQFHMSVLTGPLRQADPTRWPSEDGPRVETAVAEALAWLARVGLIMKDFGQMTGHLWIFTRRGKQLRNSAEVVAYREAGLLPMGWFIRIYTKRPSRHSFAATMILRFLQRLRQLKSRSGERVNTRMVRLAQRS